jgi:hypothetical protein
MDSKDMRIAELETELISLRKFTREAMALVDAVSDDYAMDRIRTNNNDKAAIHLIHLAQKYAEWRRMELKRKGKSDA